MSVSDVLDCFANRLGRSLIDTREQHKTDPPTRWFIAETNMGRKLKIVYIHDANGVHIKSAFPPNGTELNIYQRVTGVNLA